MDKKGILIIHPEGNINNNPNLSGIVEILCENDYFVDIVSPRRDFSQLAPSEGSRMLLYDDRVTRILSKISVLKGIKRILDHHRIRLYDRENYKLIIGVDRDGIIDASYLSQLMDIPYGLISYEIFFRDETSINFKNEEIDACKHIDFAVCQDEVRSSFLSEENHIPLEKIINIPVAGRGIKKWETTQYLHNTLNIPFDKKIALFMGSVAKWSMISELLQSVGNWPEEWVLVLHNRYGLNSHVNKLIGNGHSKSIYISSESYPKPEDLSKMLHSVDLGIALYKPTFEGIYSGNNLKYLGLSSGKIATYLQHGVPVLTNEKGLISNYIREYRAGFIIGDIDEISSVLKSINLKESYREGIYTLFKEKMDLDQQITRLLKTIEKMI